MDSRTSRRRFVQSVSLGLTGSLAGCIADLARLTGPEKPERSENAPPVTWISEEADWKTPRIHDGTIYSIGSFYVWAFDASDGSKQWRYEIESPDDSPCLDRKLNVANGDVYTAGCYKAHALDEDGQVQWAVDREDLSFFTAPTIEEESLFVGGYELVKFDRTSGASDWIHDFDGQTHATPALGEEHVFLGLSNLVAFDKASGEKRFTLDAEGDFSAPVLDDGVVFVGTSIYRDDDTWTGYLHAADVEDERWLWRVETGRIDRNLPLAVHDDTVFVTNDSGTLYAIATTDGTIRWTFETGSDDCTLPRVGGGIVYVSSGDTVHAVDADSGEQRWHASWDGRQFDSWSDSPPLVTDDALYVGTHDRMYAFDLS